MLVESYIGEDIFDAGSIHGKSHTLDVARPAGARQHLQQRVRHHRQRRPDLSAQVADFSSKAGFLASSASAGSYKFGSYMTFDLGVVAAGTVLTILHDDGISLFQGTKQIGSTNSGC